MKSLAWHGAWSMEVTPTLDTLAPAPYIGLTGCILVSINQLL